MNRIGHILVIVDPSGADRQAAVAKAAVLARRLNASMELLICDIDAHTQHLDRLEALAAPLRAQGTEVAVRTIHGSHCTTRCWTMFAARMPASSSRIRTTIHSPNELSFATPTGI